MNNFKMNVSGLALVMFLAMGSSAAFACDGGSIGVSYAGAKTCVKPQQFVKLSAAVRATANAAEVSDAMGSDDDNNDDSADASHDQNDDAADDNDDDANEHNGGGAGGGGGGGGGEGGGGDDD